MKKIAGTLLLFITSIHCFAQYNTKQQKADYMLELVGKHCSDGAYILNQDKESSWTVYISGSTKDNLVSSVDVTVHESCHGLDFRLGGFHSNGYYIADGKHIQVMNTDVVKSGGITKIISKSRLQRCDRYQTYVSPNSDLSSNKDGIYGILEEYNAYYQGLKAEIQIREAGIDCDRFEWITNSLESYYEFRAFTSWYLQYTKKYHPKVYKDIYSNKNLRIAFTVVDEQYTRLKNKIIKAKYSRNYSHELDNLLNSKDLAELEKFRLNGVKLSNYRAHLEEVDDQSFVERDANDGTRETSTSEVDDLGYAEQDVVVVSNDSPFEHITLGDMVKEAMIGGGKEFKVIKTDPGECPLADKYDDLRDVKSQADIDELNKKDGLELYNRTVCAHIAAIMCKKKPGPGRDKELKKYIKKINLGMKGLPNPCVDVVKQELLED